ncbi:MAG: TraB/GumN family protein [Gammaproteobacteria bacterium]|nr:TraB/GumN family protein [Gammaproteobacteria bacterium]
MRADPPAARLRRCAWAAALLAVAGNAAAGVPLIWKLEGERNTIWLMGSVHVLREADYPLPAAYDETYAAADSLVMEIDLDDLDPFEALRVMTARGMAAPSETLRGLIGAEAYAAAEEKAEAIGIDIEQLNNIEPWYAALTVVQLRLLELGYDPRFGIDEHFARRAAADGKSVRGLETIDAQLAILDELSPEMQSKFLLQSLDDAATMDGELEKLFTAWKSGDAGHLEQELLGSLKGYPVLYENLVVRRNRRWLEPISKLRQEPQDILVIVGALHLIGEDSVIELLREWGIKVERL